jgi:hypothetical protein
MNASKTSLAITVIRGTAARNGPIRAGSIWPSILRASSRPPALPPRAPSPIRLTRSSDVKKARSNGGTGVSIDVFRISGPASGRVAGRP